MSMDSTAWMSLHSAMAADKNQRPLSAGVFRRILTFAKPLRKRLAGFLLLSVVTAVLTVATPVLSGRVINAIVDHAKIGVVIGLAVIRIGKSTLNTDER